MRHMRAVRRGAQDVQVQHVNHSALVLRGEDPESATRLEHRRNDVSPTGERSERKDERLRLCDSHKLNRRSRGVPVDGQAPVCKAQALGRSVSLHCGDVAHEHRTGSGLLELGLPRRHSRAAQELKPSPATQMRFTEGVKTDAVYCTLVLLL